MQEDQNTIKIKNRSFNRKKRFVAETNQNHGRYGK